MLLRRARALPKAAAQPERKVSTHRGRMEPGEAV